MGLVRHFGWSAFSAALLLCPVATQSAQAPDALVVTPLADPDPNYIPPAEPRFRGKRSRAEEPQPELDEAMLAFGRAIGQAALAQRQVMQARCSAGAPSHASDVERLAWEASCRYSRR
ncbi:MAG TPA: hypothetical protein VJT70_03725 [Sphingomicrobium sp.]|nr:hypothetical protein [Sphingomicrobium sp.]